MHFGFFKAIILIISASGARELILARLKRGMVTSQTASLGEDLRYADRW